MTYEQLGEKTMKLIIGVLAAALWMLGVSCPALAETPSSDAWEVNASLYGFFPDVTGKSQFPVAGGEGVSIDASKILSHLDFAFLGTLEVRKGDWGAFTDIMYLNLGAHKSASRDITIGEGALPIGASADIHLDMKSVIWTLAGAYRVATSPNVTVDVLAGARLLDLKETLDVEVNGNVADIPVADRNFSSEIHSQFWDGIVGVKGRATLGDERKWFIPYYFDVGAGESQLTWQAMAGLGYAFRWGDVMAAYRDLDYHMKSGEKIDNVSFHGPLLAAIFHW